MEDIANSMFSEWEKEIQQYTNPTLAENSRKQLRETKDRYAQLARTIRTSEESMKPVLGQLKDQVLFLKHNLNAAAIGSLKGEAASIQGQIEKLDRPDELQHRRSRCLHQNAAQITGPRSPTLPHAAHPPPGPADPPRRPGAPRAPLPAADPAPAISTLPAPPTPAATAASIGELLTRLKRATHAAGNPALAPLGGELGTKIQALARAVEDNALALREVENVLRAILDQPVKALGTLQELIHLKFTAAELNFVRDVRDAGCASSPGNPSTTPREARATSRP